VSGIPNVKVIDPETKTYWRPEKWLLIPKKYQEKVKETMLVKDYDSAWKYADKVLKKENSFSCCSMRIDQKDSLYYVVLEKPFKP
jgi:hypothetical protein